jgi:hypothetical protein
VTDEPEEVTWEGRNNQVKRHGCRTESPKAHLPTFVDCSTRDENPSRGASVV